VLLLDTFDDLSDRPKALLQLVHESSLSFHLLLVVLLLVKPQKSEPLLKPRAQVLLSPESELNFILNLLVQRLDLG
jgi:hypothetical protein